MRTIFHPVGVDAGVTDLATLSDGRKYNSHPQITAWNIVIEHDLICVEDLECVKRYEGIRALMKHLRQAAKMEGKPLIAVDRYYPSTKTCSNCFSIRETFPTSVREWTCPYCSALHDRDVNAAKNILREGLRIYNEKQVAEAAAAW